MKNFFILKSEIVIQDCDEGRSSSWKNEMCQLQKPYVKVRRIIGSVEKFKNLNKVPKIVALFV